MLHAIILIDNCNKTEFKVVPDVHPNKGKFHIVVKYVNSDSFKPVLSIFGKNHFNSVEEAEEALKSYIFNLVNNFPNKYKILSINY